ncbi:hypothetical protein EYF80_045993 [Liparis tanakae]|uniref:Uncharacterized protein n=1 Tax=Liparis tanakae TaxID=230148 RepID=A0A4Z2FRF2_9TELE|nr:hypothetical protein EYF80_045993 [Liparis tanakae]
MACGEHGGGCTCVAQPFLQQRFELAHVLEAEVQSLEAGDRGLAEIVPVQFPHRQANVSLGKQHKHMNHRYSWKDQVFHQLDKETLTQTRLVGALDPRAAASASSNSLRGILTFQERLLEMFLM